MFAEHNRRSQDARLGAAGRRTHATLTREEKLKSVWTKQNSEPDDNSMDLEADLDEVQAGDGERMQYSFNAVAHGSCSPCVAAPPHS
eukprot:COSAG02_NODE_67_length_42609_cov_14.506681_41_plen_87_part_00